jgi:hypothetical protein
MAFNVTALAGWVNENSQTLLTQALLGSQTADLITVIPGIKYKQTLKYLETNAIIQAGGCGYSATGDTTLTDKEVSVVSMKVQEDLCPSDLEDTSMQLSMRPGKNQNIPFEQLWADRKVAQLQTAIETMVWSATNASSVKCAGFKYLMDNDAGVFDYSFNFCTTGRTASDYLNAVYAMFNKLTPETKSKTDLTLFVSYEAFALMIQALVIGNLYHIDMSGNNGYSPFIFPGTSIKVVPIKAIACFGVLTPASNLVWATDLLSESDQLKVWWSEDQQIVKSTVDFKVGTSYYWGNEIVLAQ